MKTLVMIGAGHSNLVAMRELLPSVSLSFKVILISDVSQAPYSGMLPGYLAGIYNEDEVLFDLNIMQKHYGFELLIDEAVEVISSKNVVRLGCGRSITYDCLSINTGIWPVPIECDEANEKRIIYVKPLAHFIPKWKSLLSSHEVLNIAVVGAGSAGVEVASALALRDKGPVTLYSKSANILPELPSSVRNKAKEQLLQLKIKIKTHCEAVSYQKHNLHFSNGTSHSCDYVFVTTGAMPRKLTGDLVYDKQGFIPTNQNLIVEGAKNIFAAGDCITFNKKTLPKSGVYAVKQGRVIAYNIRAFFKGSPMRRYVPQKQSLKILMIGDHMGLAVRGKLSSKGKLSWKFKNYLDTKFMRLLQKK